MAPKRPARKGKSAPGASAVANARRSERVQKAAAKTAPKAASKATSKARSKSVVKRRTSRKAAKKAASLPCDDRNDDDKESETGSAQAAAVTLPKAPTERATQEELDEDEFGAADIPTLADDVEIDRPVQFQREGIPEDAVLRLRLRIFRDPDLPRLGYYAKVILRQSKGLGAVASIKQTVPTADPHESATDQDENAGGSTGNAISADDAQASEGEEAVGYIHAWRIDKPTSQNRETSRSAWIKKLLKPSPKRVTEDACEAAFCLQALFNKKGEATKALGERKALLDDNSLLFIQMVHTFQAYQRKGLLCHILSAFNEALGSLPEWFAFNGPIVLVPGAPSSEHLRGRAWIDVETDEAEQILTKAYEKHGGYAVWLNSANVSNTAITVMGRTVPV